MITSMTGYGFSSINKKDHYIEIETKSLNSKFFDFNLKSNYEIGKVETQIRNYVKRKMIRGKIEINIIINSSKNKSKIIDKEKYLSFYKEIKSITKINEFKDYMIHNNIFKNLSYIERDKKLNISNKNIIPVLKKSINKCIKFREEEGVSIYNDLKDNITLIKKELNKIIKNEKLKKNTLSKKIKKKINSIKEIKFDKNRIEQEIFYYLEKQDINEEIVRLTKHLQLFIRAINKKNPIGKKLNFICQEIGREINTIGSKCSDFKIQSSVINMKDYLEKIKEENFNVL